VSIGACTLHYCKSCADATVLYVLVYISTTIHSNYYYCYDRYGGGLSVRGAIDIVNRDIETLHLEKLRDRDTLFGQSTMLELNYYVDTVR
jgi:hypothetical protein